MSKQGQEEDADASKQETPEKQESPENREGESAMVDVKEAARLCCFSESMIYKLKRAGKMPPPIKIGALMRWKRRELLEWIEAGCPEDGWKGKDSSEVIQIFLCYQFRI